MVIFWLGAVNSHHSHRLGQLFVIRDYHPAVTECTEVLAWEERETPHMSDGSGMPSRIVSGSDRLGRIFDHNYPTLFGDLDDQVHVGAPSKKMNRHNHFCPGRDLLTRCPRIKIECQRIDIREDRAGATPGNHSGCRKEGVRGGDDLITRSNANCHKGYQKRIGPG